MDFWKLTWINLSKSVRSFRFIFLRRPVEHYVKKMKGGKWMMISSVYSQDKCASRFLWLTYGIKIIQNLSVFVQRTIGLESTGCVCVVRKFLMIIARTFVGWKAIRCQCGLWLFQFIYQFNAIKEIAFWRIFIFNFLPQFMSYLELINQTIRGNVALQQCMFSYYI